MPQEAALTFRDFLTGEMLTANNLEQYVMRQNGKPVGVFTKSATQSITNSTDTAVTWDQETFDTDAAHSTSSNTSRYTAATAGKYRSVAVIEFAASATGTRDVWFQINGAGTQAFKARESSPIGTANSLFTTSGIMLATLNGTTDYIECFVRQSSGGALNVVNPSYWVVEYVSE
jgi:hypothetical protein